jgi:RNA polymerase sigma-70 factor, ECF subfamily
MTADRAKNEQARLRGSTSQSLLADARQDDAAAWMRLVTLYAPLLAAWCRRWRVAEQDIPDVLQEVFTAVATNLDGFRKQRPGDTFRGWLSIIARNKVRDYYRRRADRPVAAGGTEAWQRLGQVADACGAAGAIDELAEDDTESAAFSEVLKRALEAIRRDFQEQTWQAFWQAVVEGKPAGDVAAALGMQPGAVRVCKSRVLARLRRELGDNRMEE